ncbi:MAG: non-homologous end-joining DNA ligase [Dehalococcoidia bacterium]
MLDEYGKKRDFQKTPEPPPAKKGADAGPLTFVVQKHRASRLHYDFRLEVDGVLKSWSVPKGPSLDPQEKRLAVMVEDHPLDYGGFEGVIPKGEYGAGQVIVWDNGTYASDEGGPPDWTDRAEAEERMRRGLAEGKLSISMRGRKLKGSWALVKMQRTEKEWLLIKHRDVYADEKREIVGEDRSVICGLTIEDLKAGRLPDRGQRPLPVNPAGLPGAKAARFPRSVEPMLATLTDHPFSDAGWLFEPKLDGVRTIALIHDGKTKLLSRRGLDTSAAYPLLAEELSTQPAGALVLDGEIVALDEQGRPSFELLQGRIGLTRPEDVRRAEAEAPVLFYGFDILHLDGYDLVSVPLEGRRALLERVLLPTERIRLLEAFEEDGVTAYRAAVELGLEGVVAKRRSSVYEPGRRARSWLKVKATLSDEFVVGGYTQGQGGRAKTFGALVLGSYEEDGRLAFVGGVGSGFDDRTLEALLPRLEPLRTKECPFAETPPLKPPPTWVQPELVVEVKFAQRTREGQLRAPVFLRLREDKPAESVRPAEVVAAPAGAPGNPGSGGPSLESDVEEVLEQLERKSERFLLKVQGQKLSLTNLDKPLWPEHDGQRALTKRDFIRYLAQVSPHLLPHLRDRPLTLTRYPNGIHGGHFYQKHYEQPLPEFVDTVLLFSEHNDEDTEYLICNNLTTLLWLGQLADLELHTWYSRVSPEPDGHDLSTDFAGSRESIDGSLLNYPDFMVFDLDPYIYSGREKKGEEPELNRKAFAATRQVALWLKELLDSLSLSSFVKTTGRTGLHIYVPILRQLPYRAVRHGCETIGRFLMAQHPKEITMEWAVEKRTGKVFLDHNQNVRGKTLASIYSARPLPEAAVSMPLRWDELDGAYPTDFTILSAPTRLVKAGDLWSGILDAKHDLQAMLDAVPDEAG